MKQVPVDPPEVLDRFHEYLELADALTYQLAKKLRWPAHPTRWPVPKEDLVSAGQAGLLDAARRYDPSRGAAFRTFAYYRVYGAILDELRRQSPLSQYWYSRLKATEAVTKITEGEAAEAFSEPTELTEPENEEVIEDHFDVAAVSAALRLKMQAERTQPPEPPPPDPEASYERAELLSLVRKELDRLDTAQADIVRRYYFEEHRLEDIASDLGLSKSWVSRMHTRTVAWLYERVRPDDYG